MSDLSRRNGTQYALLLIDLDGFRQVNDTAGHDEGDIVLKLISARLQKLVRGGDTLARIGGDEFVVLMGQGANGKDAHTFARRLIASIQQPVSVESRTYKLGASIGIADSVSGEGSLSNMMRLADVAMYQAKRGGVEPPIVVSEECTNYGH